MNRLRTLPALFALAALPSLGLAPRLAAEETDSVKLYKKVVDSAVFIVTPFQGGMGMGSGSLIDKEKRYVLTNYHVVEDKDMVYCQFPVHLPEKQGGGLLTDKKAYIERIPAGQALRGKVLYRDKTRDLALVQLDKLVPTAVQIKLAKKSVEVGDTTWNVGSPGDVSQVFSITRGEVRAVGMEDFLAGGHGEVLRIKCRMVTATNPTNPGDSGGPLVNRHGEQVAVTESGSTRAQLVNHFVDIMEVRAFLKEKKIVIHGDDADDRGPPPKYGIDGQKPKKDGTPPRKDTPGVPPPAKKADPVPDAPNAPSPADEAAAETMLKRAKLFADTDDKAYYAKKLQEVIAKHPGTAAAKEAKKLLDGMK